MTKQHSFLDLSLYLVLDPGYCGGISGMLHTTEVAIKNGVTVVQLRAEADFKKRQWYEAAIALKQLLQPTHIPLIINDHVDIALAVDADGVHIGQNDLPVAKTRELIGKDKWLGLSISNQTELQNAPLSIIDYIGVGPVFPTQSKPDAAPALGISGLKQLMLNKHCPCVAIGGISLNTVPEVMQTGVDGIAVISAICGQANIAHATLQLYQQVKANK